MEQDQDKPQVSILEKSVCVAVTLTAIGNRRKVSGSQIKVSDGNGGEAAVDKAWLRTTKLLLDSLELTAIKKLDGEIRGYLYGVCLPSAFKGGVHLLPVVLVLEVEAKLKDFQIARKKLVEDFLAAYDQRKQEAAGRLDTLYNPTDYPSEREIRAAYGFEWQYVSFTVPGRLKEISAAFFEQEQEKAAAKWAEATVEVQQTLRAGMADLVDHMLDRLSAGTDGKKKVFRNTLVTNVQDFLATFDARNITEDGELADLVSQAKQLLAGVDPETLRKNEGLKSAVQNGFTQIKAKLDGMITDKPGRMIDLSDEAEAA